MAKRLLGKEVNEALVASLLERTNALREKGVVPTLGIVRVGADPSDLSYEKGAVTKGAQVGVEIKKFELPADATKEQVLAVIDEVNADDSIHGVLMFRPLPKHLKNDQNEICNRLDPKKDVDCMTHLSNAGVFEDRDDLGYAPCTPAACMEILDHYGIDCKGKKAVVIGRSLVVGKPAAMMLMKKNATVTICHTKTVDTAAVCREADIIISAAGVLKSLTKDYVREGQVVIDVSMNWDAEKVTAKGVGGMSGDAIFDEVEPIVEAITPVPGGVGAVTTSVLMKHVVEAAERTI
ncbi:MAG: bifunctional 5,10-methylenetetrahydrofolate dehydrogenase/5,10-methenyltetrahydrofolate cyclohydrolase [Clostridia bacterium]|nr:bifunctional 5,10-methylenetetrahydrofolate dehydrogenase/5,10-methenyltetrahydrofolate cyclohydrolase [Clostridia bacterium]